MKEIIRTCRTLHECARCFRYITFGERYKDHGRGSRVHVRCERSKTWRQMPVPELGIPRIVDHLQRIPFANDQFKGSGSVFTHTHGIGPRYRLMLNSKRIDPSEVGFAVDNSPKELNRGYGYVVHFRLSNFTYMGDAFGFETPKKAAEEAERQFAGVSRLFHKFNDKKVRRRVARSGKLAFFPGVHE